MKTFSELVVFVLLFSISFNAFSQQSAVFQIKYKLPFISSPFGICESADKGVFVTGICLDSGTFASFVLKTNYKGDVEWVKKYSSNEGTIQSRDIQLTSDSGFILTGAIVFSNSSDDGLLLKADQNGNILWSRKIGDSTLAIFFKVKQTNDLGFILSGARGDNGTKAYIAKTDSNGNLSWSKIFGVGQNKDIADDIIEDLNGDFVMAGKGTIGIGPEGYLIKTDHDGNVLWKKTYGDQGNNSDEFYSLSLTSDGGYIMTGYSNIYNVTAQQTSLVKTDSGGNLLWTKVFQIGHFSEGYHVTETSDKGFVIIGAMSDTLNFGQFFMIKTDSLGNLQWQKEYGTHLDEILNDGSHSHNAGYLLAGSSTYSSNTDMYIIKTDSSGFSSCQEVEPYVNEIFQKVIVGSYGDESSYGTSIEITCVVTDLGILDSAYCLIADDIEQSHPNISSIYIFPNPLIISTTITLPSQQKISSIKLFDELGRETSITYQSSQQGNETHLTIERGNLASGMYFLSITSNEKREVVKLMIE